MGKRHFTDAQIEAAVGSLAGPELEAAAAQAHKDFCDTVPSMGPGHEFSQDLDTMLYAAYADGRKDEREDILKALKALIAGLL